MALQQLLVEQITLDRAVQPRLQMDMFVVDEYAQALRNGDQFPPVRVFHDGEVYWLADGFHRLRAAVQVGLDRIVATVRNGTRRDAILYSVGANATHGLRRTNDDKRRAVMTLLDDPEWGQWSDNEIARQCAVSQPFVSKLRSELSYNGYKIERRVQRNGTVYTMNVVDIGGTRRSPSERIAPEVREAIRHTPIRDIKTDLLALAHMDEAEQRAVADKITKGEAKRVKEARRSIRRERVREKASALPQGLYNVVLADPPWEYDNTGVHGAAEAHYPTMSLQDICDLPETIGLQVADDAVLFLWATNPLLEDAFQVVEAWGFSYKTNLVWVKTDLKKPGAGWYVRGRHELCLICTRGSFTPLDERVSPPIGSVVEAPVRDHSRKPDELYQVIERLYPGCAYVELFARQEREGWTGWGTES